MKKSIDDFKGLERFYRRLMSAVGYSPGPRESKGFVIGVFIGLLAGVFWIGYRAPWSHPDDIVSAASALLSGSSSTSSWVDAIAVAILLFTAIGALTTIAGTIFDYLASTDEGAEDD